MKKIFFVAAAAAMMLVSCTKDNNQLPGTGNGNENNNDNGGTGNEEQTEVVVVFNELCGNKLPNKFIELYNASTAEVDLAGWTIRKYAPDALDKEAEEGEVLNTEGVKNLYEVCWTAPAGTKIAAAGYLVLAADKTNPAEGFNAGLSAKKEVKFELVDATGKVVDKFLRGEEDEKGGIEEGKLNENSENSFSRVPNGTGEWAYAVPTMGAANGEKVADLD